MICFTDEDTFLVTGASSGIGKAVALQLNELGASVILVARNLERLMLTKEQSRSKNNVFVERKDLASEIENHPNFLADVTEKYGKLRGIVLAAGVRHTMPIKAFSIKRAKELFDINFFANLSLVKGFCNSRIYNGAGSSIVLLSSTSAVTGGAGVVVYSASKAAICAAVKSLSLEVAKLGIRVNSVLPGYVHTEMIKTDKYLYNDRFVEEVNKNYPLGMGKPEYIADLICFLLSDKASWITGSNIIIDGGGILST